MSPATLAWLNIKFVFGRLQLSGVERLRAQRGRRFIYTLEILWSRHDVFIAYFGANALTPHHVVFASILVIFRVTEVKWWLESEERNGGSALL